MIILSQGWFFLRKPKLQGCWFLNPLRYHSFLWWTLKEIAKTMEIEMYFVIIEGIFIVVLVILLFCVKCGGVTRKYITFFCNSFVPLPSFFARFDIRVLIFCSSRCTTDGALTQTSIPSESRDLAKRKCSADVEARRSRVRTFFMLKRITLRSDN